MRIGIDSHAVEQDGTGNCTYYRNLILQLSNLDRQNEYILFVTNSKHPFYRNLEGHDNFRIHEITHHPSWLRVFFSLCIASYRTKIDLLHVQYFAPLIHRGRLVNTIHDLSSYHFPQYFSLFERILFRTLLPFSARKAKKIMTASDVSKMDLITFMQIPETKIKVAHCGVNESFSDQQKKETIESVRGKYGLNGKFILNVGRIDPRKNLIRLIQAYSYLRSQYSLDHKLVIIGKVYLEPETLQQTLKQSSYRQDIHFCGYVPDENLAALYSAADVFVYMSEYEGFGLPPLEAMAAGTPVVASDIAIFREILSDAAVLVNPRDVQAIAEGIHRIVLDEGFKDDLTKKGRKRVKTYTWTNTALNTLQVYEEAMLQSPS